VVETRAGRRPRSREVAAVAAMALVVTLVIAAPVILAPSERIFGTEIAGRHHDPFTVMEQFAGAPVSPPYLQPATDWIGRALGRIMTPVAAYNVLVLWTFPLAALFAYLLAYELTRSVTTSAMAGLVFAFAPFHVTQAAYHPHVAQTQWIPLYFLALWRCLHGITPGRAATLVAATGLVVLSNFYGGFIALTMTPVTLLLFWLAPSSDGRRRSWCDVWWTSALLVTLCAAALVTARRIVPTVFGHPEAFAFSRADLFQYSARWWSYLVPPVEHAVLGAWSRRVWESYGVGLGPAAEQVSLGVGVLTLAAIALWAWVRARGRTTLLVVPFLTGIAAVALVCSLSPEGQFFGVRVVRPSALLYLVVPMFRVYARFGVVVQLMIAIVAAVGMTTLWQRRTRAARAAVIALVVLTAFEYAPLPWRWRDVLPTSAHRWLVRNRVAPRVFDCTHSAPSERLTAWLAGFPFGYLQPGLPDCGEPDLGGKLRALGFTELLVRVERPEFRWLRAHARDGLRESYLAGDAAVFDVVAAIPAAYVTPIEGVYPREYDRAWTWRWTRGDAILQIENLGAAPYTATLDVELASFGVERHVVVSLNGDRVAELTVPSSRAMYRIGPLRLRPGGNQLALRPAEPPIVAATLEGNHDARPLAIAVGEWRWQPT
jgi:hypothetical protein